MVLPELPKLPNGKPDAQELAFSSQVSNEAQKLCRLQVEFKGAGRNGHESCCRRGGGGPMPPDSGPSGLQVDSVPVLAQLAGGDGLLGADEKAFQVGDLRKSGS